MNPHRVGELEGVLLDLAVMKALGMLGVVRRDHCAEDFMRRVFPDRRQGCMYSAMRFVGHQFVKVTFSSGMEGWSLIERERVRTMPIDRGDPNTGWEADCINWSDPKQVQHWQRGGRPITAGLRAFVASRLGEEVEFDRWQIPTEFLDPLPQRGE